MLVQVPCLLHERDVGSLVREEARRGVVLPGVGGERQLCGEGGHLGEGRRWKDVLHRREAEKVKDEQPRECVLYRDLVRFFV